MDNRQEEISSVMTIIHRLCIASNIGLIAKDIRGNLCVVIKDGLDDKEYVITNADRCE